MSRSNTGRGVLGGTSRPRKGGTATAADLYATHNGFRFLVNFVFFGWLTVLCLAFSSNLSGGGGFSLFPSGEATPFKLGAAARTADPAPAIPPEVPAASASKSEVLAEVLGSNDQAAPVLADYKIPAATPGEPAGARAQMTAGRASLEGRGTADIETGLVQLKAAADGGLPPAMALYGLARMAPPGGLPTDPGAGREWLLRAAQAGDAQAARLLARAYLTGSAGFAAPDKARELFRRGQELGDPVSTLALARLEARGVGGPADPVGAEQLLRIAADRGDVAAMTMLGRYLTLAATKGWAPSFDEAVLWLNKAAGQGDVAAMEGLGDIHMFLAKSAPAQDPAKGFGWYQRCAAAGRTACRFAVGRAYALAVGTAGDLPRAWAWLTLARDSGHPKAAAELDAIEARMSPADHAEAMKRLAELKAVG